MLQRLVKRVDTNWAPLLVVICCGTLNRLTQQSMKMVATEAALTSSVGTHSNYLDSLSIKVTRYFFPSEGSKGPTISQCREAKRCTSAGNSDGGGRR